MVTVLLTVGVLFGSVYTNVMAALGGDTTDTAWAFNTFGDTGTNYTQSRTKWNTTPAYSFVQNYNGRSGDYLQMYLVDHNYADFQPRLVKTVYGPGQYSVHSYAYEEQNIVDVRMAFYAPWRATYSWSASGVWSPDSSREYN